MSYEQNVERQRVSFARTATKIAGGATLVVILCIGGCAVGLPKYQLYKANTEKQSVIKEQEARSKAAEFEAKSRVIQAQANADAELIRAKGLAESQAIITETLTPEYLRYLYIQALEGNKNQIIYVPTEGGLPILESGRLVANAAPTVTGDGG